MSRRCTSVFSLLLSLAACTSEAPGKRRAVGNDTACPGSSTLRKAPPPSSATVMAQGQELQGQQLQGCQQQGTSLMGAPGTTPVKHAYAGWFNRGFLQPARVVQGQLVGNGGLLSGAALVGTWIPAVDDGDFVWSVVRSAWQDPTYSDGSTWLYSVDLFDWATFTFSPLCATDANGVAAAIPIAATFDASGNRGESSTYFTFGCTAGAIAKCYRWGYRPWLTDASGSSTTFANLHWACTRMARGDYCGDGRSWTYNGTLINIWDRAPAPGPFQSHGPLDLTFIFEAGWSTHGAVCLSKERWLTLDPFIALDCPNRLIAPGLFIGNATVCETPDDASLFDSTTLLFNESKVNIRL